METTFFMLHLHEAHLCVFFPQLGCEGNPVIGVKAVIADGFESIHRRNLALMGVIPLQFKDGKSADVLNLWGKKFFISI